MAENRRMGAPTFTVTGHEFGSQVREQAAEVIGRYPVARSALLPLLHLVQAEEGFVSSDGIAFCAELLGLETAEVAAVATFYTMYKRTPCGEHLVSVCTNTLCAALGGDAVYGTLRRHLGVGHEETAGEPGTAGSITLESAECLAACDLAPVVTVNYEYYDEQNPDSALDLVKALQRGERPAPTRGAPLSSFREVERELAGVVPAEDTFAAAVAAETAAVPTLRGNRLAEDNGWAAPAMPETITIPPVPVKDAGGR